MTKPKLNPHMPPQTNVEIAADERAQIVAFVEASPGSTTAMVVKHMRRSPAATSQQLRRLLADGLLKVTYERVPLKRAHYFPVAAGEEVEDRPSKWDNPMRSVVSVWAHDFPPMFEPMALLFGRVA